MLTAAQIKTLNRARDVLETLQEKATAEDGFNDGRVAEAAMAAELAIFNVLNVLKDVPDHELFNRAGDLERLLALRSSTDALSPLKGVLDSAKPGDPLRS